jgi:hypothetical protein
MSLYRIVVFVAALAPAMLGQSSRTEVIEKERDKKSAELKPEESSGTERALVQVQERRLIERFTYGIHGVRIRLGGLPTGQGFALGPEYFRPDLADGKVAVRAGVSGSIGRAVVMDAAVQFPRLAGGRMFASLGSSYSNLPRLDYYGPGPDSEKTGRSQYRLEVTRAVGEAGFRVMRHLSIGAKGGYLATNTGPGNNDRFIATDQQFSPVTTPGLDRQTNFLTGGAFVHIDYRDNALGPRRGGSYRFDLTRYSDRDLKIYSFNSYDVDLQQYFPFFNERRVIVLRGKATFSAPDGGNQVPFYLQPTLGGSETLRGYRAYRFYDDNMMVMNAEYRWETFSGLDMAIFADAGKVFPRRGDFNFDDLESSVGFGFRFNVRNAVFLRIDFGFSHEGFQAWFKFNNVF